MIVEVDLTSFSFAFFSVCLIVVVAYVSLTYIQLASPLIKRHLQGTLTRWRSMAVSLDAAAELGRNPVSKHQIQPEYGDEQADARRDGYDEPASRDQILRDVRGQGNIIFLCSADHEQDWQP